MFRTTSKQLLKLKIHPEVQYALNNKQPIVALESTIITHGLPKPTNFQLANSLEKIISSQNVTPATIAIIDGQPCIGLTNDELSYLSNSTNSIKAGKRDLAFAISEQKTAGTTVSGTMKLANMAGIEVFATGGIGGVHRNAVNNDASLDISSDLTELSKSPVLVVCAGVKSILDIKRTLEYLETQAVPVSVFNSQEFPAFYSPKSGVSSPFISKSEKSIAESWILHKDFLENDSGFVIAVPPKDLEHEELIINSVNQALKESFEKGISGKEVTDKLYF